jgi:hypothetical protein
MIRVTVELFPNGFVKQGQILSQTFIVNDGEGTSEYGDYIISEDALPPVKYEGYSRRKGHRLLVAKALQLMDKESLK